MANIFELFGFPPDCNTEDSSIARRKKFCPFIRTTCSKHLSDNVPSGVCSLIQKKAGTVICCPQRLYFDNYQILSDISLSTFGRKLQLFPGREAVKAVPGERTVAVFGQRWGHELRLPSREGSYFVDWILALLDKNGKLEEFTAIEVQTIDTTGSYRDQREAFLRGKEIIPKSTASFNWENVSKRIIPQIIYKGNVLQREELCKKGLYFVCPSTVYAKIIRRLGTEPDHIHKQPGSVTFQWYDIDPRAEEFPLPIILKGEMTTTVQHIATLFSSSLMLPECGVYREAIEKELYR